LRKNITTAIPSFGWW